MQLNVMPLNELLTTANNYAASIKELGIYSDLIKELCIRLEAGSIARREITMQRDTLAIEVLQLTTSLLALRERAEPVMYVMAGDDFDTEAVSTCKEVVDAWVDEWNEADSRSEPQYRTVPLYAEPPAPVVVPEDIPRGLAGQIVSLLAHNIGDKLLAQKIWNACRAGMLAATQGNEE